MATNVNKTTLKGYFNTGDQPTESNFTDFIDSTINQADGTYQSISSAVQPKMSKVMKVPLPPRVDCCLSYAFCLIKLLFDQSAETIGERLAAVLVVLVKTQHRFQTGHSTQWI